jgi:GntR family transcriptional regulator
VLEFRLDPGSGVTTYLQLVRQVKDALRLGALRPGDRLPTAREVVAQLAINPNTVHKAYRELERDGLVASRPGQGTFVQRSLGAPEPSELLRRDLAGWLRRATGEGLGPDDVRALVEDGLRVEEGIA